MIALPQTRRQLRARFELFGISEQRFAKIRKKRIRFCEILHFLCVFLDKFCFFSGIFGLIFRICEYSAKMRVVIDDDEGLNGQKKDKKR